MTDHRYAHVRVERAIERLREGRKLAKGDAQTVAAICSTWLERSKRERVRQQKIRAQRKYMHRYEHVEHAIYAGIRPDEYEKPPELVVL